jgi:two-component system chemotaxis sensor kinase CheA
MRIGKKGVAASKNLRVDSERIDHLINLVGELVMSGAQINQIATVEKNTSLAESAYHLGRIISEIRESTLRLRMVPVGGVFTRFNRVVHDLSRNLGKEVMLITMGDETELDKTVIEQISDPLMHLIRNSVDHGIEETATRIEHGKSPTGTITLKAYNEAGDIIIEVVDDGAGLDVEQIHKKAIQNELISPSQSLSKKEIMNLIFEPGLSTAKIVTSISGRGVGLDVVKKNITALNGSVEVESEVGTGTRFRIKLPLTLATIDGFLIRVADTKYVVPLDTIKECIEFERKEDDSGRRNFLNLRGEILPFINLKELFLRAGKGSIATEREYIAVVQQSGKKAGLLVDELLGEMQSVIKPLSVIFGKINGLSGITILGSGEVAFILDVHSLIDLARSREESRFS